MKKSISNDSIDSIAKVFRAIGSPIRIKMLLLLAEKEYCACKFPDLLKISQPNSSRNLTVLKKSGLVDSYREGQKNIYFLKNKEMLPLIKQVKDLLAND